MGACMVCWKTALAGAIVVLLGMTGATASHANGVLPPTVVDASSQRLSFTNTVRIGALAIPGFSTRYANVLNLNGRGIDAVVSVVSVSTTNPGLPLTINNVDRVSATDNEDLWSTYQIPAGGGEVTTRVSFVDQASGAPLQLKNFAVSVGDIDARQYVQFSGVQEYTLATNTRLAVQTAATTPTVPVGAWRFAEPNGTGAADTDQRFWAQVAYPQPVSAIDLVLGATQGGSALFQVSFAAAGWAADSTVTEPLAPADYTVSYNANGGAVPDGGSAPEPTVAPGDQAHTIAANTFAKAGSTFVGWNTAPDATGVMYQAADEIRPTTDTVLYAIWDDSVTVTYDNHVPEAELPGPTPPAAQTIDGGAFVTIPDPDEAFVRDGYRFGGWGDSPAGDGVIYPIGTSFIPETDVRLYAIWIPRTVVLTFDANGGEGEVPAAQTVHVNADENPAEAPAGDGLTRDGYAFLGWAPEPDASSPMYVPGAIVEPMQDLTLYAVWATVVPPGPEPGPAPDPIHPQELAATGADSRGVGAAVIGGFFFVAGALAVWAGLRSRRGRRARAARVGG